MNSAKNTKTKIKLLRADEVWHPHRGGRPGNGNARKSGFHTAEMKALRQRMAAFRARVKAVLERLPPSPPGGGEG